MEIKVSNWMIVDSVWSRYSKGTKYRHITYDCVICSQYITNDGTTHYEFFNSISKHILDDFSSPEMRAVDHILYYIKHEDKFYTVDEYQEKQGD